MKDTSFELRFAQADPVSLALLRKVENLDDSSIAKLFRFRNAVGNLALAEVFFAVRKVLLNRINPDSNRRSSETLTKRLLDMYDQFHSKIKPSDVASDKITEDMVPPGFPLPEHLRLSRDAYIAHLREEFEPTDVVAEEQSAAAEIEEILKSEQLNEEDYTALLMILGIHKIDGSRIVFVDAVTDAPESIQAFADRMKVIGGRLGDGWKEFVHHNPQVDPLLAADLQEVGYAPARNTSVGPEVFSSTMSVPDMIALIRGGSLNKEFFEACVTAVISSAEHRYSGKRLHLFQRGLEVLLKEQPLPHEQIADTLERFLNQPEDS